MTTRRTYSLDVAAAEYFADDEFEQWQELCDLPPLDEDDCYEYKFNPLD